MDPLSEQPIDNSRRPHQEASGEVFLNASLPQLFQETPSVDLYNESSSNLPVALKMPEIIDCFNSHNFMLLQAETGSGKTTKFTEALFQAGFKIVVAEPTRLAVRTLSARVADELNFNLGEEVGYRTALDRLDSSATRLMFCTSGLALVRELMGHATKKDVLILDDVHVPSLDMEVLMAWARHEIESGAEFKLVLMSGTPDVENIRNFFPDLGVVTIPGRQYEITELPPGKSLLDDVAQFLSEWKDVLVFQPGKVEINEFIEALRAHGVVAQILPLHGELEPREQKLCFQSYGKPKCIVATNVAQSSLTIPGITAVVDSGMVKRVESKNGVEGLYLRPISIADRIERMGRCGREGPGFYIDHCPLPKEKRPLHPVPEMERMPLDKTILRLAHIDVNIKELPFPSNPPQDEMERASQSLFMLDCLDSQMKITPLGKKVDFLPVTPRFGVMLNEAEARGVLKDMIDIAAILEVGGILTPNGVQQWCSSKPSRHRSDLFLNLRIFRLAQNWSAEEMKNRGVRKPGFYHAQETVRLLTKALRGKVKSLATTGNEIEIVKSLCAGMTDQLYMNLGEGAFTDGITKRYVGKQSCIKGAGLIVGVPIDIHRIDAKGREYIAKVIRLGTEVSPSYIEEVAPQIVSISDSEIKYEPEIDSVCRYKERQFGNLIVDKSKQPIQNGEIASQVFATWLTEAVMEPSHRNPWASINTSGKKSRTFKNVMTQVRKDYLLVHENSKRLGENIAKPPSRLELYNFFLNVLQGSSCIADIPYMEALRFPFNLEAIKALEVERFPSQIQVNGTLLTLRYESGKPSCVIDSAMMRAGTWRSFPDEGVSLPNGERVKFVVTIQNGRTESWIGETFEVPKLKKLVAENMSHAMYKDFNGPPIEIPDFNDPVAVFPPIQEIFLSERSIRKRPFFMYGILKLSKDSTPTSPVFDTKWDDSKKDALSEWKEARLSFLIAQAMSSSRAKSQIELCSTPTGGLQDLRVMTTYPSDKHRHEVWVLTPNGDTLAPSVEKRDKKSTGLILWKEWKTIQPDSLVLAYHRAKETDPTDADFRVLKLPLTGLTQEQLVGVERIEDELGVPTGTFGLNDKITRQMESLLKELASILPKIPIIDIPIQWESFLWPKLLSETGITIAEGTDVRPVNLQLAQLPKNNKWNNQSAKTVFSSELPSGYLELLLCQTGTLKLQLRFKKMRFRG